MSKKKVDRLEPVASEPMAGPAMFYFDGVMVPADKVFAKISPEEVKKILDITISTYHELESRAASIRDLYSAGTISANERDQSLKLLRKLADTINGDSTTQILKGCLLYTSPSPRDRQKSRMPSSA